MVSGKGKPEIKQAIVIEQLIKNRRSTTMA